jgi:phosphoglycolate phosphatase-like HAD superfamily hydrolase
MKVYFDLDGVLADFESGYNKMFPDADIFNKDELDENKKEFFKNGFFLSLPVIEEGIELLKKYVDEGYDVEILTSVGDNDTGENALHKQQWVDKYIPYKIKMNWVKKAKNKSMFANNNSLLIDDREQSLIPFKSAGGNILKFIRTIKPT